MFSFKTRNFCFETYPMLFLLLANPFMVSRLFSMMTIVNGNNSNPSSTNARRSLFASNDIDSLPNKFSTNSGQEIPDDDEFEELMMSSSQAHHPVAASGTGSSDCGAQKKRFKQSTLDQYPNEDEMEDLFVANEENVDPWLVGSKTQPKPASDGENLDLQYPDSEDELEMFVEQISSASTQLPNKADDVRSTLRDVSAIRGSGAASDEAERAHQRLMAAVRKVGKVGSKSNTTRG